MKNILPNLKLTTPPNLPKGEEKSPVGGFRGSILKSNFHFGQSQ